VYGNESVRGRLAIVSASLVFSLSNEILKWQFPANAVAEKITFLRAALRSMFLSVSPQLIRR
jgi:hypothetical protein